MSSVGLQPDKKVQSHPAGSFSLAGNRAYLLGLLIFCTIALYYPVRTHPFVNYDDNLYVTDNVHVQTGLNWETLRWALVTYDAGNWHPLTWLSHALDVALFDLDPGRQHQTSMLLHALNAGLLFWVLWRATGYAGRSFMVAALFAVHPINVESVVWIAERKTVLSMLFFLLALGAYRWYVAKPHALRYAVVAVLFALGLMAKPQIITFPLVLLLWDYWPLGRLALRSSPSALRRNSSGEISGEKRRANREERPSGEKRTANTEWRWLLLEKLPLFAIAAGSAVMTMQAQTGSGAVLTLNAVSVSMRLSNAIVSYVRYLEKALWPVRLAPMYPHPGGSLPAWQICSGALILIAITAFVAKMRTRRYLLVGWLWFLGTLVPMIGLVQVGRQAMADRYAYLPLLGIFIMVCWGVADWAEQKRLPAALLPALSVIVILALSLVARRQIGYWADNVTLWTHTIAVTPPNYIAQDDLGGALMTNKRLEEAIVHFRLAAAMHPTDPISAFNIAFYEQQHGNLLQAIQYYKQALVLTPRASLKILALDNMAYAYRRLGNAAEARACFDAARKLQGQ
ncbi:MAG: tetratricopeptide repeat protein [Candidatus Korobacteraceae bacterium]